METQIAKLKIQNHGPKTRSSRAAGCQWFELCVLRFAFTCGRRGFTLIEILVAMALLVLLAVFFMAGLSGFLGASGLEQATDEAVGLLREARSQTLAAEGGEGYGVRFASSSLTRFRGGVYVPGDPGNTVVSLPRTVAIIAIELGTTSSSVTFERLTGAAAATGTIRFQAKRTGRVRQVEVLPSGLIRRY